MNEIISNIYSVLISAKRKMNLSSINQDYEIWFGEKIPYKQHGFQTLKSFIISLRGLAFVQDAYGEVLVDIIPPEKLQYIINFLKEHKRSNSSSYSKLLTNPTVTIPKNSQSIPNQKYAQECKTTSTTAKKTTTITTATPAANAGSYGFTLLSNSDSTSVKQPHNQNLNTSTTSNPVTNSLSQQSIAFIKSIEYEGAFHELLLFINKHQVPEPIVKLKMNAASKNSNLYNCCICIEQYKYYSSSSNCATIMEALSDAAKIALAWLQGRLLEGFPTVTAQRKTSETDSILKAIGEMRKEVNEISTHKHELKKKYEEWQVEKKRLENRIAELENEIKSQERQKDKRNNNNDRKMFANRQNVKEILNDLLSKEAGIEMSYTETFQIAKNVEHRTIIVKFSTCEEEK